jgi:hypothetical protein
MFTKKSLIVSGALILGLACTGIAATSAQTVTSAAKKAASIPLQTSQSLFSVLNITRYLGNQGLIRDSGLSMLVGDLEHLLAPGNQITSPPSLFYPAKPTPTSPTKVKKHPKYHPVRRYIRPVSTSHSSSTPTCSSSTKPSTGQQKPSTCGQQSQQSGKQTPVVTQQTPR